MMAILAIEIPAIGNRTYTDKTHLRGLKTLSIGIIHFSPISLRSLRPLWLNHPDTTTNNYN
ncbi:hypothetical protein [Microcoleus sp. EPA2]|uniref:hypothetical protein n=1 Tax=Microcoleus sp. EPA2 TaxID=2841654 RepID=UPI00312B5B10